jgi:signal peptidase I
MKDILGRIASLVMALVVIILILLAYGSINNRFYRVVTIDGNSMSPTFWFGDVIIITKPPSIIPIGSIIMMNVDGKLVTHRLIGYENGRPITKGDANPTNDNFTSKNIQIVGIYFFHIPRLGYISIFSQQFINHIRG